MAKRKFFIYVLTGLFLLNLTWYVLSPGYNEISNVIAPYPGLLHESPQPDNNSGSTQRHLWQDNRNDIAFLQNAAVIIRGRETVKNSGDAGNSLSCSYQKTAFNHAVLSYNIVDFSAFSALNSQAYLHLDIPPPHSTASL